MDVKHGLMQLFIAFDQLLNVLTNPFSTETWADETLSSRCGRLGHRYPYKFWKVIIDAVFGLWQGPNHCVRAFEKECARYNCPPIMRGEPVKIPQGIADGIESFQTSRGNVGMWPIIYPFYVLADLAFKLICIVLLNWWAPVFAVYDEARRGTCLPNWLAWVDTFDADLDTGNREMGWNQGYWGRVRWLYRNTAYGFSYWALGCPFILGDWYVVDYVRDGDGKVEFEAQGPGGRFNFYGVAWGIRYKFGWKAWNYFDPATEHWKPYPWGPQWRTSFVFSISKA